MLRNPFKYALDTVVDADAIASFRQWYPPALLFSELVTQPAFDNIVDGMATVAYFRSGNLLAVLIPL